MPNTAPKSWLPSANTAACNFPLQSLAFCAFLPNVQHPHLAIGIGDSILDLHTTTKAGLLDKLPQSIREACTAPVLNPLMQLGHETTSSLRRTLTSLLAETSSPQQIEALKPHLHPIATTTFTPPIAIPDYTDFYASLHHATNVGRLFRPDQPLLPNYKHLPIGYHGRASSIILSNIPIRRPSGQTQPNTFAPTQQLDFELEVAAYIAPGNPLGVPIPIAEAESQIFGLTLLNDWSARDIQSWEYQPLGPFLGKSFATTISPWVLPIEALAPYRIPTTPRPATDPATLPYLTLDNPTTLDLHLEAFLTTARTRAANLPPHRLTQTNLRDLYWTFPQMIAHHTSNGCNLQTGDLLATGTISGPTPDSLGSLIEITHRGTQPLHLPNGETRTFLQDGDEIILRAQTHHSTLPRLTLGECRATIL